MKMMINNDPITSNNTIFYLSANEKYSLRELAKIFENINGTKLNIMWGNKPYREREVMIPQCYGKLLPDWKSTISLADGIRDFLEIN